MVEPHLRVERAYILTLGVFLILLVNICYTVAQIHDLKDRVAKIEATK